MKNLIAIMALFLTQTSLAALTHYDYSRKEIRFVDSKTGESATVQEFVVYHQYDFPCILDGSRPSTCVDGETQILPVQEGRVIVQALRVDKQHLFSKNPRIGLQVTGSGVKWFSLKEFNQLEEPFTFPVFYHQ